MSLAINGGARNGWGRRLGKSHDKEQYLMSQTRTHKVHTQSTMYRGWDFVSSNGTYYRKYTKEMKAVFSTRNSWRKYFEICFYLSEDAGNRHSLSDNHEFGLYNSTKVAIFTSKSAWNSLFISLKYLADVEKLQNRMYTK